MLHGQALVGGEAEAVAAVVERLYACEELVVHHHLVGVGLVHGIELLGNLHHFGRGIALLESGEHGHHAVEDGAGAVEGQDGVVEGGGGVVVGDGLDLLVLLLYAGLEGGQIVVVGDLVERRDFVRSGVLREERVLVHLLFVAACGADDESGGDEGGCYTVFHLYYICITDELRWSRRPTRMW